MKLSLKKLVTVILLMTAISCTKEPLNSPSAASIQTQENATQKTTGHYIGERFGGGVIFLLSKDSLHGGIADTDDLPLVIWYNSFFYVETGSTATRIGSGRSNTNKIIAAQGTSFGYAALECKNSSRGGYTDWFLPSKNELNTLYKHKNLVGGFSKDYYWSSSEYGLYAAWAQHFGNGNQVASSKDFATYVRAIRAF